MGEGKSYKRRKSIKNWRQYNAGLKRRYDVTVYMDEAVLEQAPKPTGKRGRPFTHGDALIHLCLTLRCLLRLPLRYFQQRTTGDMVITGQCECARTL